MSRGIRKTFDTTSKRQNDVEDERRAWELYAYLGTLRPVRAGHRLSNGKPTNILALSFAEDQLCIPALALY